jgi:hypothetical protein
MLEKLPFHRPRFFRLAIPPKHVVYEGERSPTCATRKINSSSVEQLLVGSLSFVGTEHL